MQGLQKYKIGLLALGVVTLILLVYVFMQSSGYKQDKETNSAATAIAEDLNSYIRSENKIPDTLDTVTQKDVPDTISYQNNDDGTYTFCTTYNSGSSGNSLDANDILLQGISASYADPYSSYESSYVPSSLYLSSYSWSEGEKCHDVEPNIYVPTRNSSLDRYCEPQSLYYEYYRDSCVDGEYIY